MTSPIGINYYKSDESAKASSHRSNIRSDVNNAGSGGSSLLISSNESHGGTSSNDEDEKVLANQENRNIPSISSNVQRTPSYNCTQGSENGYSIGKNVNGDCATSYDGSGSTGNNRRNHSHNSSPVHNFSNANSNGNLNNKNQISKPGIIPSAMTPCNTPGATVSSAHNTHATNSSNSNSPSSASTPTRAQPDCSRALTPSNNISRNPPNSANRTPSNNYAAPHTPIASAKRPRHRSSTGAASSAICSTPVASSADHNGSQFSPMHPPTVMQDHNNNDNAQDRGEESTILKTLFSPVLSFLNGSSNETDSDNDPEDHEVGTDGNAVNGTKPTGLYEIDDDGDVKMTEDADGISSVRKQLHTHIEDDEEEYHETVSEYYEHEDTASSHEERALEQQNIEDARREQEEALALAASAQGQSHQDDDDEEDDEDEFNPYLFIKHLPPYQTLTHPWLQHNMQNQNIRAMAGANYPWAIPPKDPNAPPVTLVLDLDETLVHCTVDAIPDSDLTFPVLFGGTQYQVHVKLRPHLDGFLSRMSQQFEIVVFTASQKVYANELLDRIDPQGTYIKHRMFRESCLPVEGNYLKDLNVLGPSRSMEKMVLVDNSPHAFGYQVDNGIPIESWFDDPHDTELLKLEAFLQTLHGVKDVREMVREKFQTYKLVRDS